MLVWFQCFAALPHMRMHFLRLSTGAAAAAYAKASGMAGEDAKQLIGSDFHLPTKAFWVINHANSVHPERPVVVVYENIEIADVMHREFQVALVEGAAGKPRPVFRYGSTSTVPQSKVQKERTLAAFKAAVGSTSPPPVLLAQCKAFSTGTASAIGWSPGGWQRSTTGSRV